MIWAVMIVMAMSLLAGIVCGYVLGRMDGAADERDRIERFHRAGDRR